jgi:phosphatidylinositol alpha 1,6-mannosyltransferase
MQPRVALFADTFHEVNGAARTCREWQAFAQRRQLPFLCVRWGKTAGTQDDGAVRTVDMVRSGISFPVDTDLSFDPQFLRMKEPLVREIERFRPDIIHITSPGDLGIMGAILASRFHTRLALSWHTNLHEFAARRVSQTLSWIPAIARPAAWAVEAFVMNKVCWFFGRGDVVFAPNPELISTLTRRTGKQVLRMGRGIDTQLFHPSKRQRTDDGLVVGFVGRLMPEKNLRLLPRVEEALRTAGLRDCRFVLVGEGGEREWLSRHLNRAEFTGVLKGEPLARAYADMDIFAFPSRTDTFGNVVQEAMASGVPAVVTDVGGPRFIVRDGISGAVASSDEEFCTNVVRLAKDEAHRRQLATAARKQVESLSWDHVFEEVYSGYAHTFQPV